jgi:hypothetical protein
LDFGDGLIDAPALPKPPFALTPDAVDAVRAAMALRADRDLKAVVAPVRFAGEVEHRVVTLDSPATAADARKIL